MPPKTHTFRAELSLVERDEVRRRRVTAALLNLELAQRALLAPANWETTAGEAEAYAVAAERRLLRVLYREQYLHRHGAKVEDPFKLKASEASLRRLLEAWEQLGVLITQALAHPAEPATVTTPAGSVVEMLCTPADHPAAGDAGTTYDDLGSLMDDLLVRWLP